MSLAACANDMRPPRPTPDTYEQTIQSIKLIGDLSCGLVYPPGAQIKRVYILPRGGGDTVLLGRQRKFVVFDSASPTTAARHDTILMQWAHPSGYRIRRVGPHLLLCGVAYWQEVVVLRQYCHDSHATPPWNNQIEEITFPHARETWLADEIFDSLPPGNDYPGLGRIRDRYGYKGNAMAAAVGWRVRPFRDVLPPPGDAAKACDAEIAIGSSPETSPPAGR